jgi:class 3 adenylate cyclase/tetratricopeptide (TPR) repeat protein
LKVASWLRNLGLERYEPTFRENEIDSDVLPQLTAEDLTALGVTSVGHRRKLLAAIAALRDGTDPTGSSDARDAEPTTLVPEGERREVTVLFADLAGYTRLSSELDAEEVHALLGRFFELIDGIIESYGGSIDKHIGDCAMAAFGAPTAHSNDPERAVRAALDIQREMPALGRELGRPVGVHIGVASGQVVASGTGSDHRREYTVTGESVNLASRLTDEAPSGAILVSDAVYRMLSDRLECAQVGELSVKGLEVPVTAWRVAGLREAESRGQPFIGRRSEVHQFRAALEACQETGRGQAIYVRGEAGIGKTRLVEEFQRLSVEAGSVCHTGLVLDFGAGTGRDAIRALVRGIVGLPIASPTEVARAAAAKAIADGLVAADDAVFLNDLLDLAQPVELRGLYDAMDNASRIRGKQDTVARLVAHASRAQPLLLVVEDVHWADGPTLDHLARLTHAVADCPALLVITSRVEGDPLDSGWRARTGGVPLTTIDLGPLRPEEVRALVEAFVTADAGLVERCIKRSAGNPLFLEQLLRHAEDGTETGVPGSIRSLVQARLDQLETVDKAALQAASVLGQRFGGDMLAHLLGEPGYAPERLAAHLVVRPEGEAFLFAHAVIRDAIYDTVLKSRRRALHQRAAEWFAERDLVLHAEHLERAESPDAPRAYLTAARAQADGYRYNLARRLVERGLALATAPADRFALACFHGDILHDLGEMAAAGEAYDEASAAAHDDSERCRAWIGRAAVKRVTEDLDGAFADLAQAESAARAHGLIAEQARIHFLRGNLYFPRGEIEGCLEEHGRSLELARRAGSAEAEAAALGGLGDAEYVRGRMRSSHERLCQCVELSRRHGFGRIEVANHAQIAHTMLYLSPQRDALDEARGAAEAAARVGHRRAELNARVAAVFALLMLSELDACRAEVASAQALVRHLGAWRFEQSCLRALGYIALAEGRSSEAIEHLRHALDIARETGMTFHGPNVLGDLALAVEAPDERRAALAEAEAIIAAGCVGHNQLRFYPAAIDTSLELADFDQAERYARALEDFTGAEPLPWADFFCARGRALAAYGCGQRDKALTKELERLSEAGARMGYNTALPAITAAIAAE